MSIITTVLRLIRFPYLMAGVLIMFVTRFMIIKPLLGISELKLQFSEFNFGLLVFSLTALIAAGYIINDYFDSKMDRMRKNSGTVIDKSMPRLTAISLHTILNLLGILTAAWVSDSIGMLRLSVLFILATGVIWFYSTNYKYTAFMGKIILSAMIACLPLIITIYEIPDLNRTYSSLLIETGTSFKFLFNWTGGFAVFLFVASLIRLIIKEKVESAGTYKSLNLSIQERLVLYLMYLILVAFFVLLYINIFNKDGISPWYFSALIILPALISIGLLRKNTKVSNLKLSYFLIMLINVAGIGFTFLIEYLFSNNLI